MKEARKLVDKMYDMYKSLDDMNLRVFDVYHDMMYHLLNDAEYLIDEECYDEIKDSYIRMKELIASARHMNNYFNLATKSN